MKKRIAAKSQHSAEFKGVVKKMTGELTNDPQLEKEGREEMLGLRKTGRKQGRRRSAVPPKETRGQLNPDPYRRS